MGEHDHITLSQLQQRIASALGEAMPLPLWISAEIADIKVNSSGHCYMELVEKAASNGTPTAKNGSAGGANGAPATKNGSAGGANGTPETVADGVATAQARGVIWRTTYARIAIAFARESGVRLAVGMKILFKAVVTYHPLYGLSLQISDIDAAYTLGDMERQKQQTIAQLQSDGVWDMNHSLEMPAVVQRIAVISSASAAGYRDFCREMERSPYRLHAELFEAVMQGATSEQSIIDALSNVAQREEEFDAVAIIRGGGATTDLGCFNSYMTASCVAQFPLPVITGIGHDKDTSITDMVAHTMLKTPTAVAVWLHDRAEEMDGRLEYAAIQLRDRYTRLTATQELRLQSLYGEILAAAQSGIATATAHLTAAEERLQHATAEAIKREERQIESLAALAATFAPENILRLGFGIARLHGRVIRSVADVKSGESMEIDIADGTILATVTQTRAR